MKMKIIGICVITLLMTSLLVGIVTANDNLISTEEIDIGSKISGGYLEYQSNDENKTDILTVGPMFPFLNAAEITLIDGPFLMIALIELILGTRSYHFVFPNISINVKDLAFSVRYTKNIPQLPNDHSL